MPNRISHDLVRKAKPPSRSSRITYDAELKGFGLRVTAGGSKAFILNYRFEGRERRYTIGSYPEWSAAAARKRAEELKRQIDLGTDPLARRQEDRAAATVAELCSLYEERHLPKKRPNSQRNDLSAIHKIIVPRLGRLKIAKVSYTDVEALHRDLSQTAPFRANRVIALLSRLFSLAIKWGIAQHNPAKGIERNPEQPRARYLDKAELDRLVDALAKYPNQNISNAIRLLLLTGARKSEVLTARWGQFDLEQGIWVKPAATVKQARLHRVPLSRAAVVLLREMQTQSTDPVLLFPSRKGGQPITEIKKAWGAICQSADLNGVRLHDLRHTYASHLVSTGSPLPLVGALLGHTQAQTTHRYSHLLDDPLREATNRFGQMLQPRNEVD